MNRRKLVRWISLLSLARASREAPLAPLAVSLALAFPLDVQARQAAPAGSESHSHPAARSGETGTHTRAVYAQHGEGARPGKGAPAAGADQPMTSGEVRRIDRRAGKLTLRHGPIPGLGMPEMTMAFSVADPAMLDGLEPSDQVRFRAERIDGKITITELEASK